MTDKDVKPIQFRLPPQLRQEMDGLVAAGVYPTLNKLAVDSISAGITLAGVVPESVLQAIKAAPTTVEKFKILKAYLDTHEVCAVEVIVAKVNVVKSSQP